MTLTDETLDQLSEAEYLCKLYSNKGFYQIPLKEEDKPKTAFVSPWGKFELTECPLA